MTLHLFVLMLSLLSGGSARVVSQFENNCDNFFANKIPPTRFPGSEYKQICQTLYDDVHYATYYDTYNKTPVYSAYKFEGKIVCERKNNWYIEPQLDDNNQLSNMKLEKDVTIQGLGDNQALNGDYVNPDYHRGHLAPVYHARSQSCSDATFTLTNAAPQDSSFNQGQWRVLEREIAKTLAEQCLPKMYSVYIVTGVVPGEKKLKNRVNVPSHFWTAFCCLDQNNKCQISRGFIGENKNIPPNEKNLSDLEEELVKLYDKYFKVFDNSTKPTSSKKQESKAFKTNATCSQFWFCFPFVLFLFYLP